MEIPNNENPMALEMNRPAAWTMVLYGNNGKRVDCFNLNEKVNCQYLFQDCENLALPEGVTFNACTNAAYMFYHSLNVKLPSTATFENCTNFNYFASTPHTGRRCEITGVEGLSFSKATTINLLVQGSSTTDEFLNATFENVVTAGSAFDSYRNGRPILNLPKATFEKCTSTFSDMFAYEYAYFSERKINMPVATFASLVSGGSNSYLNNLTFNIPSATFESL